MIFNLAQAVLLAANPPAAGFVEALAAVRQTPFYLLLLLLGAVLVLLAIVGKLPLAWGLSIEAVEKWRPLSALLGGLLLAVSIYLAWPASYPSREPAQSLRTGGPAPADSSASPPRSLVPRYAWVPVEAAKKVPYRGRAGVAFGNTFYVWFTNVTTTARQRRIQLRVCLGAVPSESSPCLFDDFVELNEAQQLPVAVAGHYYQFKTQQLDGRLLGGKPRAIEVLFSRRIAADQLD